MYNHKPQLCETCANYAGGCSWIEVGIDGRVRFIPVPGWTAKKVPYTGGINKDDFTYEISACPQYAADPPRKEVKASC